MLDELKEDITKEIIDPISKMISNSTEKTNTKLNELK